MFDPYDNRKKIEMFLLGLLVVISIIYGGFKTYPLINGPRVTIYNPQDGDIVSSSTFEISGIVTRVKEIMINGRPIPIGTDGHFTEILTAQSPYTTIVVTAHDFYGATITKTLRVIPR